MRHLEPLEGMLEAFVRRMLNDPNAVADVLQAAMGTAFREFRGYAEGTNFRAWIFHFVHLEVLNNNRRTLRTRHQQLLDDVPTHESWDWANDGPLARQILDNAEAVLQQCDEVVARAIARLPQTDREVLLLRAIGDLKYREIAETLQIPLGTVMSSLSRSRIRLRWELAQSSPHTEQPKRDQSGGGSRRREDHEM